MNEEIYDDDDIQRAIERAVEDGKMMYWNDRESILRNWGDRPIYGGMVELVKDDLLWLGAMKICEYMRLHDTHITMTILLALALGKSIESGRVQPGYPDLEAGIAITTQVYKGSYRRLERHSHDSPTDVSS